MQHLSLNFNDTVRHFKSVSLQFNIILLCLTLNTFYATPKQRALTFIQIEC